MSDILGDSAGTKAVRDSDLIGPRPPVDLDLSKFVGSWVNADLRTPGLVRVACSLDTGRLVVRAFGAGANELEDWGEASNVVVYADSVISNVGSGLTGRYDFPFMVACLQANLKGGVMVAAA